MTTALPPIEILLVEDNPADIRLTKEALKEASVANRIHVARDGAKAIDRLRTGTAVERPDLILLDLNLPKKHGLEVLAEIKTDVQLRYIPVIILTTSQADQDIQQSYQLGANAVITKPVDLDQFLTVIRTFDQFWLTAARLCRP